MQFPRKSEKISVFTSHRGKLFILFFCFSGEKTEMLIYYREPLWLEMGKYILCITISFVFLENFPAFKTRLRKKGICFWDISPCWLNLISICYQISQTSWIGLSFRAVSLELWMLHHFFILIYWFWRVLTNLDCFAVGNMEKSKVADPRWLLRRTNDLIITLSDVIDCFTTTDTKSVGFSFCIYSRTSCKSGPRKMPRFN